MTKRVAMLILLGTDRRTIETKTDRICTDE